MSTTSRIAYTNLNYSPLIYFGDQSAYNDVKRRNPHKFNYVLTICLDALNESSIFREKRISYRHIQIGDIKDYADSLWQECSKIENSNMCCPTITPFGITNEFIENAIKRNEKVLIVSPKAQSRSVAIVIAYLMKNRLLNYSEALSEVKKSNPQASPNAGFVKKLKQYESFLRSKKCSCTIL